MAVTVTQVGLSAFVIVLFFIFAKIFVLIMDKAKHFASKTKFSLDDRILQFLVRPIRILIVLAGVFVAVYLLDKDLEIYGIPFGKIFNILAVVVGAYLAARVFAGILQWYQDEIAQKTDTKFDDHIIPFIKKFVYVIFFVIAGVFVLHMLGIQLTPLLAGLGIASLAIALALQDTLSNVFSAIWVGIERPIKPGDYIEIDGGKSGYVEDISWRTTKIRTLPNNLIIVPNSTIAKSIITNYQAPNAEVSVVIPVSVGYNSDLEKVEKVTIDVAKHIQKTVNGAVKTHDPLIRYNEFQESGIGFSVILRAETFVDQYLIKHEFIKQLHKRFKKEKIEIPFPQRVVHLKKR
ncbi:MAG: mechanosensitive ion channel family protein [Candidatus Nanoarchaeia archaeon]